MSASLKDVLLFTTALTAGIGAITGTGVAARSAEITWVLNTNGTAPGFWSNSAGWSTGAQPTAADNVTISDYRWVYGDVPLVFNELTLSNGGVLAKGSGVGPVQGNLINIGVGSRMALDAASNILIQNAGTAILEYDSDRLLSQSASVSGTGGVQFQMSGGARATIDTSVGWSGITYVSGNGTLAVTAPTGLANAAWVQIQGRNSTLDLSGSSTGNVVLKGLYALSGGSVTLGDRTLTLETVSMPWSSTPSFTGTIAGTGSIILSSGGQDLSLADDNAFTGTYVASSTRSLTLYGVNAYRANHLIANTRANLIKRAADTDTLFRLAGISGTGRISISISQMPPMCSTAP